jgi:hypothetical protein
MQNQGGVIPNWANQPVCVAASGPSSPGILAQVHGLMRVIVINRTYEAAPWADMLYAADSGFWAFYKGAREFAGLKIAPDRQCQRYCPAIKLVKIRTENGVRIDRLFCVGQDEIGGGGFSGFQALNIALLSGANPVYLAGYDFKPKHWHSDHPAALRNPNDVQLARWKAVLEREAPRVADRVFNLSKESLLNGFEHRDCGALCAEAPALPA